VIEDVTAEALDKALDELVVKELLICPAQLKGAIAHKCNLLETEAIFYQGELWLIEADFTLGAARFDYLEGKATLVNLGDLTIEPDVEPKTLASRLDKVHNFGDIYSTPQQMAALQSRLGLNRGDFSSLGQAGAEEDNPNYLGNVGHLKL
jgi:hypothetical protein